MSYRWFDFSRQIFWDNNNQDLSIPGTLRTSTTQISSLITLNISTVQETVNALTVSSIGINCNAPAYRLDVNGTGRMSTFIVGASNLPPVYSTNDHMFVNGFFDVYNTTQASTLIRMAGAFGRNYIQSGTASTASVFAPADIVFGSPSAVSEYVRFTSTGRVGIGTGNPAYTLDILGSNRVRTDYDALTLQGTSIVSSLYINFQKPGMSAQVGWFGNFSQGVTYSSIFGIYTPANTSIAFYTGSATPSIFCSTNNGNVGINCNTPAFKLDVSGTTHFDGNTRIGASNAYYDDGNGRNIFAINTGNNANYGMQIASPSSFMQFVPNASATGNLIRSGSNNGATLVGQDLLFQIGGTEVIRFMSTGITRIGGPGQLWIGNTSTLSGQGSVIKLRTDGTPTTTTTYQIEYNNGVGTGANDLDIRFVGASDAATQRKFDFGYYTSDNRSNAWNSAMSIASQNKSVILNGAVSMPSLPNNNVLITSAQQQILLSNAGVYMYMQSATNRIRIGAYSNVTAMPFTINESGGDVGVGCNAPRYNLDLVGNMHVSGQYFDDSDQRVKENIVNADVSICYSTMKDINLKYFQWNCNFQSTSIIRDRHQLGFLAQEIKQIFPNSVYISSNYGYDDFHGLEMKQINAMHYGATKKLMELVEQQGSTIQGIQQQLSTLQKS